MFAALLAQPYKPMPRGPLPRPIHPAVAALWMLYYLYRPAEGLIDAVGFSAVPGRVVNAS